MSDSALPPATPDSSDSSAHWSEAVSEDDHRLAAAFPSGDADTLRQVYDRYGGLVFRIALRALPTPGDAEEATQATFVSAWHARSTYRPERAPLSAWLGSIARRRAIDRLRVLNRERLAAYLNTDRSALCRELSRMKKDGIIDFDKKGFVLLV